MKKRNAGQGLVEFALVLPLFLGMLMGVVDVGRGIWAANVANHSANEAARFAIVHGGTGEQTCPVGPSSAEINWSVVTPAACKYADGTAMALSPSKDAILRRAREAAVASGATTITVQVCYGPNCSGNADTTTDGNARGIPITITVHVQTSMVTASLIGVKSVDMSSTTTMLVNR